jgi:hypothetical protein
MRARLEIRLNNPAPNATETDLRPPKKRHPPYYSVKGSMFSRRCEGYGKRLGYA